MSLGDPAYNSCLLNVAGGGGTTAAGDVVDGASHS